MSTNMSAVDVLRDPRFRIHAARVDLVLPLGIHRPKLQGDVGWDLEAMKAVTIMPMEACDVPVNVQLHLPPGFYAEIRNRSSMAKRGLYVDQNIIDTGYRGPLFVMIRNMTPPPIPRISRFDGAIVIKAGERIAQVLFHRVNPVWLLEVNEITTDTERAMNGFGSTGK